VKNPIIMKNMKGNIIMANIKGIHIINNKVHIYAMDVLTSLSLTLPCMIKQNLKLVDN
jgi:hypothetical protein